MIKPIVIAFVTHRKSSYYRMTCVLSVVLIFQLQQRVACDLIELCQLDEIGNSRFFACVLPCVDHPPGNADGFGERGLGAATG